MPDVNDPKLLPGRPADGFIDPSDDLPVVFRNVILKVDHHQRAVFHHSSSCMLLALLQSPAQSSKRSTSRFSRAALRLSVWHFDLFDFSVSEPDHAGISALRAEQRKILQYRMRPYLRPCFFAAAGAAKPIQLHAPCFSHCPHLPCSANSYLLLLPVGGHHP